MARIINLHNYVTQKKAMQEKAGQEKAGQNKARQKSQTTAYSPASSSASSSSPPSSPHGAYYEAYKGAHYGLDKGVTGVKDLGIIADEIERFLKHVSTTHQAREIVALIAARYAAMNMFSLHGRAVSMAIFDDFIQTAELCDDILTQMEEDPPQ